MPRAGLAGSAPADLGEDDADRPDGHLALHHDRDAPIVVGEPDDEPTLVLEDAAGLEDRLDDDAVERPGRGLDALATEDAHLERLALVTRVVVEDDAAAERQG